ncbi:hypothetical protein ACOME3_007800 [Neoechinorhynchus agilis]
MAIMSTVYILNLSLFFISVLCSQRFHLPNPMIIKSEPSINREFDIDISSRGRQYYHHSDSSHSQNGKKSIHPFLADLNEEPVIIEQEYEDRVYDPIPPLTMIGAINDPVARDGFINYHTTKKTGSQKGGKRMSNEQRSKHPLVYSFREFDEDDDSK